MINRIEQSIELQKIPDALLPPKTIGEILNEPGNPLRTAYLSALAILAELHHEENEQVYRRFIECKTAEEREARAEEIAEAYKAREEARLLANSQDSSQQQNIIVPAQAQVTYPQLIPILVTIAYHLDEWQNAQTTSQKLAVNHQIVQTWHVNQLIQNATNQTVTLPNGRVVSIGLDPQLAAEIRERMNASKGLIRELKRIPVLQEQWKLITDAKLANKTSPTNEEKIAANQEAADKLNLVARELTLNLLRLVPDFGRTIKKKLGDDYEAFVEKYFPKKDFPKNGIFDIAQILLKRNIDFDNWGAEIKNNNKLQIENNVLVNKHKNALDEAFKVLKAKSENCDEDFRNRMVAIFDAMTPEDVKNLAAGHNHNNSWTMSGS